MAKNMITKVEELIRLAVGSHSEEEARTAAVKAVRLIALGQLRIVEAASDAAAEAAARVVDHVERQTGRPFAESMVDLAADTAGAAVRTLVSDAVFGKGRRRRR